jgi:hypothetical protein
MARIICAHCKSVHASVPEVKACYRAQQEEIFWGQVEHDAEMGVERFYENRGFDEARNQEDHERRNGVTGFQEAWADWNRTNGINDGVHGAEDYEDGLGDVAAAERANEHSMTFGSAYAQMSSYEDYMEREREAYYGV